MTDTEAPSASNGEPLTTLAVLDTSVDELGPLSGDSLLREQSASPEPISERRDYFNFEGAQQGLRRRSTHPPVATESLEGQEPGPLGRASTTRVSNKNFKSAPPSSFDKNTFVEDHHSGQSPRRNSTIGTQNSLSFDETAVWDQKAILSLGKCQRLL